MRQLCIRPAQWRARMKFRSPLSTGLLVWTLFAGTLLGSLRAAEWTDTRELEGFQVRATFDLAVCPDLLPDLILLERDLCDLLQLEPRTQPVHLLLFDERSAYERYLQRYFRGAPLRRALFIKGSQPGWVFAYRHSELEIDVRHETTHALLHTRLATVPLWLDEGLAEYFEVAAERRRDGNPHQSSIRWAARFYRVPDLGRLEELSEVREMQTSDYRAAWAWTHFLLHGPPQAHAELVQYVRDLQQNVPPGRLSTRLEQTVPDLRKEFLRHHR